MGRGKPLNSEEKGKIMALHEMGLSNKKISQRIGRSATVVDNFIHLGANYGVKKAKGGPQKIGLRDKGKIREEARKNKMSASQIKSKLNLPVTVRRIQQILHDTPTLVYAKRLKKPALTDRHRQQRLQFARDHMSWTQEWTNVIFSDEKKFNLDGPDGWQSYWHDLRDQKEVRMSRNFGGGSVMIWAAFGFNGKTPIMWVPPKMNAAKYQELLELALDGYADDIGGTEFIFQHDNAAVHRAHTIKDWFEAINVEVLPWPARSPDLNPIENLGGILARKVYAHGKQYSCVDEVKTAIKQSWSEIEVEVLRKLIESMPNRIFQTIQNKGGSTKY